MTNRRTWMKWLPAALLPMVAKAQGLVREVPPGGTALIQAARRDGAALIVPEWVFGQARNNECPSCARTAEPYINPATGDGSCIGINGAVSCGPASRITRCKRCNTAFWQDEAV